MQVYFLIDRSGSMDPRWTETINSVNGYVKTLKDNKKPLDKIKVSVALFDGQEPFALIRKRQHVENWIDLSDNEYRPRGVTPLYDAIGSLYNMIMEKDTKRVSVVILTDGFENASHTNTREKAKEQMDQLKAKGYDVVFLGADFDAFSTGATLGVSSGFVLNASAGNYGATMDSLAARSMNYMSTGATVNFTDEDRDVAVGKKTKVDKLSKV